MAHHYKNYVSDTRCSRSLVCCGCHLSFFAVIKAVDNKKGGGGGPSGKGGDKQQQFVKTKQVSTYSAPKSAGAKFNQERSMWFQLLYLSLCSILCKNLVLAATTVARCRAIWCSCKSTDLSRS